MGGGGFHLMRFRPPRSTGSGGGSSLHAGPRLTGLICLLNMETTSPPQSSPSCFETCQVDTKCGPGRCACVCVHMHLFFFFFIIIISQNRIQLHCDTSAAAFTVRSNRDQTGKFVLLLQLRLNKETLFCFEVGGVKLCFPPVINLKRATGTGASTRFFSQTQQIFPDF